MKNTDWLSDVRDCTTSSSGKPGHVFSKKVNVSWAAKNHYLADFYTWDCNAPGVKGIMFLAIAYKDPY